MKAQTLVYNLHCCWIKLKLHSIKLYIFIALLLVSANCQKCAKSLILIALLFALLRFLCDCFLKFNFGQKISFEI